MSLTHVPFGRYALAILLALGLAAGACKKQPYLETVRQTPYLALPPSQDYVLSIDTARLRAREGFGAYEGQIEDLLGARPVMDALRTQVGLDPFQDINRMIVASRGQGDAKNPLKNLVLVCKVDLKQPPEKILENLRAWLAEEYLIAPPAFRPSTHDATGAKVFATSAQSQYNDQLIFDLNFAFLGQDLMIFSFSQAVLNECLEVVAGTAPGIAGDAFWSAMLKRPDIGAMFWGTGNISRKLVADLGALSAGAKKLQAAQQYYFNLDIAVDLRGVLGLVCQSTDEASGMTDTIRAGLKAAQPAVAMMAPMFPELAKLPERVFVTTVLETSRAELNLTEQQRRGLGRDILAVGQMARQQIEMMGGLRGMQDMFSGATTESLQRMLPGGPGLPAPQPEVAPTTETAPTTGTASLGAPAGNSPMIAGIETIADPATRKVVEEINAKLEAIRELKYSVNASVTMPQGNVLTTMDVSFRKPNSSVMSSAVSDAPAFMKGTTITAYSSGDELTVLMQNGPEAEEGIRKQMQEAGTSADKIDETLKLMDMKTPKIMKLNLKELADNPMSQQMVNLTGKAGLNPFEGCDLAGLKLENESQSEWVFSASPGPMLAAMITQVRVTVDRATGLMKSSETKGTINSTQTMSKVVINPDPPLADSVFVFTPPPGAKLMDPKTGLTQ